MAVFKIFPSKDTFIFTEQVTGNAGRDEILEIAGYADISDTGQTARAIIKFSDEDINSVINDKINGETFSASLHLYLANASELPVDFSIYGYPLYLSGSEDWDNGRGKFGDLPVDTTGISWKYYKQGTTNAWPTLPVENVTGSYTTTTVGGGTWYTGSSGESMEFTQSFNLNSDLDLNLDITPAIKQIYSGSLDNNGFILKLDDSLEYNTTSSIRLKYFSGDTNTIYPPSLEFKWDDSNYVTGSLNVLSTDINTIKVQNNRGTYTDSGKQRFRLHARPKYPTRTFTTGSIYKTNYALPQETYWGLRDENTEEMVINFDTSFTKVSCDGTGPYFDIYMDGLQPERYYRVLVKTTIDGTTTVINDNNIFKVVRNG